MKRPPSPVRQAIRVFQLGMGLGLLAVTCEALIARPLLFSSIMEQAGMEQAGPATVVFVLVVGNLDVLVISPLLVAASAVAIEFPPVRVMLVSQFLVLAIRASIASLSAGLDFLSAYPSFWIFSLIAAAAGTVFGVVGCRKVGGLVKRRHR